MKLPDIDQLQDPTALVAAIDDYIDEAQRLTGSGEEVALAGLDSVVDALCNRVVALSAEERRSYASDFEALINRLSALQSSMVTSKEQIAETLKTVSVQRKANRAYAHGKAKNKEQ